MNAPPADARGRLASRQREVAAPDARRADRAAARESRFTAAPLTATTSVAAFVENPGGSRRAAGSASSESPEPGGRRADSACSTCSAAKRWARVVAGGAVLSAAAEPRRAVASRPGAAAAAAASALAAEGPTALSTERGAARSAQSGTARREARRKLAARQCEVAAADRVEAVAQLAAIEVDRAAGDGDDVGGAARREPGRQQARGGIGVVEVAAAGRCRRRLGLQHLQRREPLAGVAGRGVLAAAIETPRTPGQAGRLDDRPRRACAMRA